MLQQFNSRKIHLVETHVPSSFGGMSAVILTLSCGWRYWQSWSHWRLSLKLVEEVKESEGISQSLLPVPAANTARVGDRGREPVKPVKPVKIYSMMCGFKESKQ